MTDLSRYYTESYPPSLWEPVTPADGRDSASPGNSFTEPEITAQDAIQASKLTGLGFVADPLTAWTVGQSITINPGGFLFSWNGTQWNAGAPVAAEPELEQEPSP